MNYTKNPELLDRLSAAYALGTMRGGARRRFEVLARQSPLVRASALLWRERISGLNELEYAIAPSPQLWKRIHNLVTAESLAQQSATTLAEQSSKLNKLGVVLNKWRFAAIVGGVGSAAAVLLAVNLRGAIDETYRLEAQLKATPAIQYVAVLADDKSNASVLVTFDPKSQRLTIKRVGEYQEASDKSLQLWALPTGAGPQSLGVMDADRVIRLAVSDSQVRQIPALAISLEPKGGVPSAGGPTGPVLFKGALLETPL